jgi:hypothetical protein
MILYVLHFVLVTQYRQEQMPSSDGSNKKYIYNFIKESFW